MIRTDIINWVQSEFKPIQLITGQETISQFIDNAVRYLNTHSAFKYAEMISITSELTRIQVSANIKTVVKVLPSPPEEWITQNYPQWSLLGISILDGVNNDLIMMTEAFKNYKGYISSGFKWHFERSNDPTVGGNIYLSNQASNIQKIYVLGTRRFSLATETDEIIDEAPLRWILEYVKALVKQAEGNALRKSSAIGVNNDGQTLYNEGREEMKDLQEQLMNEGRWVALASRI